MKQQKTRPSRDEKNAEVESLRQALIEGEQSGIATDFDFDKFRQQKMAAYRRERSTQT